MTGGSGHRMLHHGAGSRHIGDNVPVCVRGCGTKRKRSVADWRLRAVNHMGSCGIGDTPECDRRWRARAPVHDERAAGVLSIHRKITGRRTGTADGPLRVAVAGRALAGGGSSLIRSSMVDFPRRAQQLI